jgi:hypothetical protein
MKQTFIEDLSTFDNVTLRLNRQSNWFHPLERMKTNGSARNFISVNQETGKEAEDEKTESPF